MYIKIKNERNETLLRIKIRGNKVEVLGVPSKRKSWVSDVWEDSDQKICYEITTKLPEALVEQISNDALLDELRNRMTGV